MYSDDITPYVNSFCNNINTINGGLHLDTAKDCLCRILQMETKKALNATEQKKLDILYVDVLQGLNYAVNLETDMNVQFSAQVKSTLTNEQLIKPMRTILNTEIANYFNTNKSELDRLIKIIKLNAKARIEVNKVKTAIVNEKLNVFAEHKMKNFAPANNRGKNQYREIFLIEGDSAKGSAMLARDPDTQAVFAFRGVTLNAFKNTLADIMNNKANPEYRDLVKVLKCGIGETFNMDRLHYDKIIIMTDADIDGAGITSLICAFFVLYYPDLVKAGKVYKVLPPLYGTSDKKDKYILNKAHYSEKVLSNIKKAYKLKLPMSTHVSDSLNEDELKEFILDIKDYKDAIKYMNTRFKIESSLIERILSHIAFLQMKYFNQGSCTWHDMEKILLDVQNNSEFIQYIRDSFPELSINGLNIHGIVNGGYRTVTLSKSFFDNGREVLKTIRKYGPIVEVKEKKKDITSKCSILDFITLSESCYPDIVSRYKGLGEQDPKELKETTMNPLGRRLIQLTCSDYDRVLEQFKVLHSDEAKYAQLRKDMVNEYKIAKDDLDN